MGERLKNRLTLENLALSERYLKGELRVRTHYSISSFSEKAIEFYAFCEREHSRGRLDMDDARVKHMTPKLPHHLHHRRGHADGGLSIGGSDRNQESVFFTTVQLMELPETVSIASLIRLCRFEQIYRYVATDDWFQSTDGSIKAIGSIFDREKEGISPCTISKLPNEVVKSTSEIVNNVAKNSGEGDRRFLEDVHNVNLVSGLLLVIVLNFICAGVLEPLYLLLEVKEVMFGPFNLGIDSYETIKHDKLRISIQGNATSTRICCSTVYSSPGHDPDRAQ